MNVKVKATYISLLFITILLICPVHLSAQQNDTVADIPISNAEPSHAYYSLGEGKEIILNGINDDTRHRTGYEFQFRNEWSGKQLFASLSGINTPFQFHINGFHFGNGKGDQRGLEFNITPFLDPGTNRVDLIFSQPIPSDSSCPQTTLISRETIHVRDVQVTSFSQSGSPETLIRVHLFIRSYLTKTINSERTLNLEISDSAGEIIFYDERDLNLPLAYGQEIEMIFDHTVPAPKLWSPHQPDLYELNLSLYTKGVTDFDIVKNWFGIRSIDYQDSLMIINSDSIVPVIFDPGQIEGFCRRTDSEILQVLREGNYNVILTNDYLPARLMNLFDQSGIVILIRKNESEETPDRAFINRPSVVWIE